MSDISRRSLLSSSFAATAFTIIKPELVRGAGNEKLKYGLIGCGGRGTQAVQNVLTGCDNVEIVAMADIFEDKMEDCLRKSKALDPKLSDRFKVDAEHRFVGFEAFKKVLASDIDVVMLATPPAYRPMHFAAAVEAKKHIFCEKPMGTDPVNVRKYMAAAKKSEELKLTVKSGAQRRSQAWYLEQYKRVKDGEIGDIVALNANWVGTPVLQFNSWPNKKRDPKWSDMEFQNRGWYSFVWICGDQIVEQHLHNIDVCNWFMGTHPVEVTASGGAAWRPREEEYGNIFDHIVADFVYPSGVHMTSHCRQYNVGQGNVANVSERIVGTKGVIDSAALRGAKLPFDPYVQEHMDMVNSILGKGPYLNESMAVAESTMTCIMGRESAYSGLKITWDMIMGSQEDLMPKSFEYKDSLAVPPLPVPGQYKFV